MQLNKLSILFLLLIAKLSMFADTALPNSSPLTITKYYFANVDTFPEYKFFAKKIINDKTYKIKQDASFLINPAAENEKNKIEVWAVNNKTNEKTNSFILTSTKSAEFFEFNTAHIAITFYFDKGNKLNYKQTFMKPECYNKKLSVPFLIFNKPASNSKNLPFLSLFSFLILISLFAVNIMNQRKVYV